MEEARAALERHGKAGRRAPLAVAESEGRVAWLSGDPWVGQRELACPHACKVLILLSTLPDTSGTSQIQIIIHIFFAKMENLETCVKNENYPSRHPDKNG